jgi:PAS domain S-box-containing protein
VKALPSRVSPPDPLPDLSEQPVARWKADVWAVALTLATLGVWFALRGELGGQPTLVIFTIPIMASAYLGGLRGGLISTALSFLLASYYVLPPVNSFAVASNVQRWQQLLITLAGVMISVTYESLRRARNRARDSARAHVAAESRLREGETRHRALIDWSPEPVVVHAEGKLVFVNPAAIALFGAHTADDLVGMSVADTVHPDFRSFVSDRLRLSETEGVPTPRAEEALLTLAGATVPVEAQSIPIHFDGARAILTSFHDITERRVQAAEIARLNSLYAALSHISGAIARTSSRDALLRRVCEVLVKEAGFRMAWIGWYDAQSRELQPVAECGDADGFLKRRTLYVGEGPVSSATATAFREDRPVISAEMPKDLRSPPGSDDMALPETDYVAAFPVRMNGTPCGVLNVHSGQPGHFGALEVALLEEAAGEVSFALGNFARDAAQQHAENVARIERTFNDTMIESMPGILYFYDADGRFLRWNRSFETVSGYSGEEVAARKPLDYFGADSRARVQLAIAKVFETGEATVEADFMGRDGRARPYYLTGRRVLVGGEPFLLGMGIDISQQKHTEDLLRASESGLASAQRLAHLGSWELDLATGVLSWSDEIYRIFGIVPEAFDASFAAFIGAVHPDDRARVEHAQQAVLAGEASLDVEHRILRPDGSVRWVHELAELRRDIAGHPVTLAGTVHDISERHDALERLRAASETLETKVVERTAELQAAYLRAEAADRTKSAFLATMSHELRTPLNSIIGFTSIVLQGMAGAVNEEQTRQLGMVRGSARHLLELINDVLDLSKIEAGQLEVHADPFDLRGSIERVFGTVAPMAEQKGLSLLLALPPTLGELVSDRRRVEQILLNLLGNAIKFTERGSVTLRVSYVREGEPLADRAPGGAIRFAVSDTGIGISPENLATLFEPFRQIDSGLARQSDGTGLGLAISRRLASLLGGSVLAESTLAEGSTFTLTLPHHPVHLP